jgi:hypothetical protein
VSGTLVIKHRMIYGRIQGSVTEKSWLILDNILSFIDRDGAVDVVIRIWVGRSRV